MARLARLVIPGLPYHVTQRGNRRGTTFFEDGDYAAYRELLADAARAAGTGVWAYCLMPNHVHLIVVPGGYRWPSRDFRECAPPLCPADQCPQSLDRAFVAGPVRRGGDGRNASGARRPLCLLEPGPGAAVRSRRAVALVERAGPFCGRR